MKSSQNQGNPQNNSNLGHQAKPQSNQNAKPQDRKNSYGQTSAIKNSENCRNPQDKSYGNYNKPQQDRAANDRASRH